MPGRKPSVAKREQDEENAIKAAAKVERKASKAKKRKAAEEAAHLPGLPDPAEVQKKAKVKEEDPEKGTSGAPTAAPAGPAAPAAAPPAVNAPRKKPAKQLLVSKLGCVPPSTFPLSHPAHHAHFFLSPFYPLPSPTFPGTPRVSKA